MKTKSKGLTEILKIGKRIRVRRKSDGKIGYIRISKFDPKKYERVRGR
jgi:C-terminal processing protease CtpA/Prc